MKNILFVVFLFLPFLSYSQVFSHSFEDSVLTVFVKPIALQSETDTIYPSGVPKKINFVFEDVDVDDYASEAIAILVRGRIIIDNYNSVTDSIIFLPTRIRWSWDYFVTVLYMQRGNFVDTLVNNIHIIPQPIADEINRLEKQRIDDSTSKVENHLAATKYYEEQFEKLKQPQENLTEKDIKEISKIYSKMTTPHGIKIDTTKFIDKTEIANEHWLEYLHYLLKDSSSQVYEYALPDSNIWYKYDYKHAYNFFHFNYFRRVGHTGYPISGITYEQAQGYCMWRTNVVNTTINEMNKLVDSDYEIIVYYRLPTKEEWEYAAIKDDLDKQFGGESSMRKYSEEEKEKIYRTAKNYRKEKGYKTKEIKLEMQNYFENDTSYTKAFNYKKEYTKPYFIEEEYVDARTFLRKSYHYSPTRYFKLYNIFGNVAEMTSEKGIAKGGSFAHSLEECAADKVQKYDSPQAWLGFRCIVEVVVRKKEQWEMPTELQRFQYSKEHQENLTDEDKKKIAKIYSKLKLSDGIRGKLNDYKKMEYTKVTNAQWMEYLSFLLKDSVTEQYLNALPDTMIWNKFYQNGTVDYHFLRNPTYKDFPVVGITYEQAQQYCIWKGNMDTKSVNEKQRKKYKDYELILSYKLPTKEEWEYAVPKYDLNKESKSNIAEMTSKKGIAKGGSFAHTLEESAADKVQKYDSPQAWLGFRCVTEVVVRKKE